MPQTIQEGALSWQRLAVINKHPRDDRIQFDEVPHIYTIDGSSKGWVSCTGFIHQFFAKFDAFAVSAKIVQSPKSSDPTYKYFGMTAEQIRKMWDDNSAAGTRMHLDIEHFYNAMGAIDEWKPKESPEWSYFRTFQRKHVEARGLIPFRTEWIVFDEEHKLCGSVDMVFKKPDGTFAIYDWKRSEEIKKENRFQSGWGPVDHLQDVNYWHYSLQLNVYRHMLQKNYGCVVSELVLVILHPINSSYKLEQLNLLDEEIMGMLESRKKALEIPGNDGSSPVTVF